MSHMYMKRTLKSVRVHTVWLPMCCTDPMARGCGGDITANAPHSATLRDLLQHLLQDNSSCNALQVHYRTIATSQ